MSDICPVCSGEAVARCRCLLGDRRCANGHQWHRCQVHGAVVVGAADHSKGSEECSCKGTKR